MPNLRNVPVGAGLSLPNYISHPSEAELSALLPYPLRPGRCTGHFFDHSSNKVIDIDLGNVFGRFPRQYPTVSEGQNKLQC
jgi:hypothetical protein